MDPSFLFMLILGLLAALATVSDVLSWNEGKTRKKRKKKPTPPPLAKITNDGNVQDRKTAQGV